MFCDDALEFTINHNIMNLGPSNIEVAFPIKNPMKPLIFMMGHAKAGCHIISWESWGKSSFTILIGYTQQGYLKSLEP